MKSVLIDTTSAIAMVAAVNGEKASCRLITADMGTTAGNIIPALDEALKSVSLDISEVEVIAAISGPGSFTGIRIGVSVANAIAYALNIPRVAFTSFDLMRQCAKCETLLLIDAGHGNYYSAVADEYSVLATSNITIAEVQASGLPKLYQSDLMPTADNAAALLNSIKETDYTDYILPFYMKKSQAERKADNE